MFRKVGKVPEFALLNCGLEDADGDVQKLWRRYILAMDGFECDITEVFPDRDMFVRDSWIEEGITGDVGVEEGKQRYAAAQTSSHVSVGA